MKVLPTLSTPLYLRPCYKPVLCCIIKVAEAANIYQTGLQTSLIFFLGSSDYVVFSSVRIFLVKKSSWWFQMWCYVVKALLCVLSTYVATCKCVLSFVSFFLSSSCYFTWNKHIFYQLELKKIVIVFVRKNATYRKHALKRIKKLQIWHTKLLWLKTVRSPWTSPSTKNIIWFYCSVKSKERKKTIWYVNTHYATPRRCEKSKYLRRDKDSIKGTGAKSASPRKIGPFNPEEWFVPQLRSAGCWYSRLRTGFLSD